LTYAKESLIKIEKPIPNSRHFISRQPRIALRFFFMRLTPIVICRLLLGVLLWPVHAPAQDLPGLISLTLAQHPSLRAQWASVRASAHDITLARHAFAPAPSVSWERTQQRAPTDTYYAGDPQVVLWRLNQPLWTGGRLSASLDKAKAQHQISELQAEETRLQLALKVVQSWVDWYSGSLKQHALEQSLQTHQQLQAQIARRVAQGLSASGDTLLSTGRLAQTQAEVLAAQMQTRMALMRLEELAGQPIAPLAPDRGDALTPPDPDRLWAQAETQSATLQRLQVQQSVLSYEQTITRASALPEVFVRAERQMGNHATLNTPSYNRVFVGLSASTGAGLSVMQQLAAQQERLQALQAEYEAAQRQLREQIQSEWLMLTTASARRVALERNQDSNAQLSASYARQFDAGKKTWIDVMNAARELAQVQTQQADALASEIASAWRLRLLSQGLQAVNHHPELDKP
jgi:adhesin transport system outer membrane protein